MRRMGIEALARQPGTSKRAPGHKIYPYLLRTLVIDRSNSAGLVGRGRQTTAPRLMPNNWAWRVMGRAWSRWSACRARPARSSWA